MRRNHPAHSQMTLQLTSGKMELIFARFSNSYFAIRPSAFLNQLLQLRHHQINFFFSIIL